MNVAFDLFRPHDSGVSWISARGVLKLRPITKSGGGVLSVLVRYEKRGGGGGGGGGGCCRFLVRYEKRWGGGGGGAVSFWPDTKSRGGGWGGVLSVSGPIQARIPNVLEKGAEKLARAIFWQPRPFLRRRGVPDPPEPPPPPPPPP